MQLHVDGIEYKFCWNKDFLKAARVDLTKMKYETFWFNLSAHWLQSPLGYSWYSRGGQHHSHDLIAGLRPLFFILSRDIDEAINLFIRKI